MKKNIVFGFIAFLFLLFSPQNASAQIYNNAGSVCSGIGTQSSCPVGYICKSNGAPGNTTGTCQQSENSENYGGLGEPCTASKSCDGSLICSTGNICVNPTGINTTNNATTAKTSDVLCDPSRINTAIGCIPVLNNDGGTAFMGFVLKWAVGVGGGIAFLLILYAGFMLMTSTGNPERIKAGQELMTSAISGLILLIFSVFILNFIGIDILGLDAFGF